MMVVSRLAAAFAILLVAFVGLLGSNHMRAFIQAQRQSYDVVIRQHRHYENVA